MIDNETILESYNRTGSVWKTGEELGLSGQTIHYKLKKIGKNKKVNIFTKEDEQFLLDNYIYYRDREMLKELASILNRTKPFICRKAKELGLTDIYVKPILTEERRKKISLQTQKMIADKGHPKGMLGKNHTLESKNKMSIFQSDRGKNGLMYSQTEKGKKETSVRIRNLIKEGKMKNGYSMGAHGWCEIGGNKMYLRSSWEYNISLLIEYYKNNGYIKDWSYEPKRFYFEDNKDGILSYTPDFKIISKNGNEYYIELKGWMSDVSKNKIKKFKKEYGDLNLIVIDEFVYKKINNKYKHMENWDNFVKCNERKCEIDGCDNKHHSKGLCRHHFYKVYGK